MSSTLKSNPARSLLAALAVVCSSSPCLASTPIFQGGPYEFDGIDQSVEVGPFAEYSQVTIMAWVRPHALDKELSSIFAPESTGFARVPRFSIASDGRLVLDKAKDTVYSTGTITPATQAGADWVHVAVTHVTSSPSVVAFYIDGVLDSTHNLSRALTINLNPAFDIGAYIYEDTDYFYDGNIEDFRIYDTALNAAEITAAKDSYTPTVVGPIAPRAVDDGTFVTDVNTAIAIDVPSQLLVNDIVEFGDSLSLSSFTQPANGSVTQAGDTLTYTPDNNFAGLDTFEYTVIDGDSLTDTATVTVEVDTKPAVVGSIADQSMIEDQSDLTVDFSSVFDSASHAMTVSAVTDRRLVHASTQGTNLVLSLYPDRNGTAEITVRATSAAGFYKAETSFTLTVSAVNNDPPVAINDGALLDLAQEAFVDVDVLDNDRDPDVGDSATILHDVSSAQGGTVSDLGGGVLRYTPPGGYTGADSFNYSLQDGSGNVDSAAVNVWVTTGYTGPGLPHPSSGTYYNLIPMPVSVTDTDGYFTLPGTADIYVETGVTGITEVGQYLADKLNPATGYGMTVIPTAGAPGAGNIHLTTTGGAGMADEEYRLEVTGNLITLIARDAEGLFRGVQTIRQLFPYQIEQGTPLPGATWQTRTCVIEDQPRFEHRGLFLDMNGQMPVEDTKKYIDDLCYYKLNTINLRVLHGQDVYRVEVTGNGALLGDPYWTQAELSEVVAHAAARHIEVNIALKGNTWKDHLGRAYSQLAPLINGPYIHIWANPDNGSSPPPDYVVRAEDEVQAVGKTPIVWQEAGNVPLDPDTIAQQWRGDWTGTLEALAQGNKLIISNGYNIYLDAAYDSAFQATYGRSAWCGQNSTENAYDWDPTRTERSPGEFVEEYPESSILGVEAPMWTLEGTKDQLHQFELLQYPRIQGIMEVAWSPRNGRDWEEYKVRLASYGPRMDVAGITYYDSPLVPWPSSVSQEGAPTGLTAVSGDSQASLDWDDLNEPGLESYTVYRGTISGGPYVVVASNVTTSDYVDTGLTNGTPYFYVVTATISGVESGQSDEAGVIPLIPGLPVAHAGADQVVVDTDDSGSEVVDLDAVLSYDPDGTLVAYTWRENGVIITSTGGPLTTADLPVGLHLLELTVTDNEGNTATDTVQIVVSPAGADALVVTAQDGDLVDSATWVGAPAIPTSGTSDVRTWRNLHEVTRGTSPAVFAGRTLEIGDGLSTPGLLDIEPGSGTLTVRNVILNSNGRISQDNDNNTLVGETMIINGDGGLISPDRIGKASERMQLNFENYSGAGTGYIFGNNANGEPAVNLQTSNASPGTAMQGFTGTIYHDRLNGTGGALAFDFSITEPTFAIVLADTNSDLPPVLANAGASDDPTHNGKLFLSDGVDVMVRDLHLYDESSSGAVVVDVHLPLGTYTLNTSVNPGAIDLTNVGGQDYSRFFRGGTGTVTVAAVSTESAFASWVGDAAGNFLGTLTDPDPTRDFDGGALPTGIEWVTGGDPTDPGDDVVVSPGFDATNPDDFLFIFARSDEAEADANTTIRVEYGSDLATWRNTIDHGEADGVVMSVVDDGFGAGFDKVTVAIPRTLEVNGALFARLKVTITEP